MGKNKSLLEREETQKREKVTLIYARRKKKPHLGHIALKKGKGTREMVTSPQKTNASSGAESNCLNSKIIYNRYLHLVRMLGSDVHFSKP
jgi:hypothetical protein